MNAKQPTPDPNFYKDGSKKMIAEGMEAVSKIMAFIKQNETKFQSMEPIDRKKAILEFEPSKLFNQVHPIVFQYMAVEGVFHAAAFKRYVISVFGKPPNKEETERMRHNRRYLYHHKNAQNALYYKYLLVETNPNIPISRIHAMYEEVVDALNEDTDKMLDAYEKAEADAKVRESEITDEKRKDLVQLLKKNLTQTN